MTGWPALIVAVPLLAAALLAAAGHWLPRIATETIAVVAATAGTALALFAMVSPPERVTWLGGWAPRGPEGVGIALVADRFGTGLAVLAGLLVVAGLVYTWTFYEDVAASYHALILVFQGALAGFALAGDLFNAFVFFELMGAAAYVLTGYRAEEPTSVQGALNFGIVNSLGASFCLLGIALLYARTGELNLRAAGSALAQGHSDGLVVASFALLAGGFLVKAAVVPFHFWTADAEAVAPSPVCALFSGVMVMLGCYGVARVWWEVYAGVLPAPSVRRALLVLGAMTALVGAAMCLAQRHAKRMLAYSTISHVGVVLLGFGVLRAEATTGAAVYLAGHAGVAAGLFLAAGGLLNRFGTVNERDLFGRARRMRWTGTAFVVGALGLSGVPGLGLWSGKALTEHALVSAGLWPLVPVVLVSAALTGAAVLRFAARTFAGVGEPVRRDAEAEAEEQEEDPETQSRLRRLPVAMLVPMTVLVLAPVVTGLPWFVRGVDPEAPSPWSWPGVVLGLAGGGLTVLVAAAGLWRSRLPGAVAMAAKAFRPAGRALVAVHRSHIGDYVAWTLVGVVLLALLAGV
ncbi:complex I subunit 5 family protein [Flindersiella endophytica]